VITRIRISSQGQGLLDITSRVQQVLQQASHQSGLCSLMIQHTSASLIIQENADPSVQRDLENWLNRLVSENDALYTHTMEGADDMPAHLKSVLTNTSLAIPYEDRRLCLGVWQAIYLWEHRYCAHEREIVIHLGE